LNRTGRYAPTPSGDLHLGNLRTALLAWLLARSQGARFLLRIEDLDRQRCSEQAATRQLADLRALGLDWDEPDEALMRQSERGDAYELALDRLRERGLLYECYCSRSEIREAASAPHEDGLPEGHYPGTCRDLSEAERAARRASGRPAALRVRAEGAEIEFVDRVYGRQRGLVDDFVVRRNDGTHGYNLAVVVDDAAQGIGEVVRGRDLLDSTPRQIWLGRHLGLGSGPTWVHLPLVLGPDGRRLAKRHGAVTLAGRRALGEGPAETRALLAGSVGLCAPDERPGLDELVGRLDLATLPREDAPLPEPRPPR
jgi:glutamyl-tRNA synthetase